MGLFGSLGKAFKSAEHSVESGLSRGLNTAKKLGKDAISSGENLVGGVVKEATQLAPEALQIAGAVADPEAALTGLLGGEPGEAPISGEVPAPSTSGPVPTAARIPADTPEEVAGAQTEVAKAQTKEKVSEETTKNIEDIAERGQNAQDLKQIQKLFPGNDPTSVAMRAALAQQKLLG